LKTIEKAVLASGRTGEDVALGVELERRRKLAGALPLSGDFPFVIGLHPEPQKEGSVRGDREPKQGIDGNVVDIVV
jgi:hypothetical protein